MRSPRRPSLPHAAGRAVRSGDAHRGSGPYLQAPLRHPAGQDDTSGTAARRTAWVRDVSARPVRSVLQPAHVPPLEGRAPRPQSRSDSVRGRVRFAHGTLHRHSGGAALEGVEMSEDMESATGEDVPPPCPNDGACESEDVCTCWTCEICDTMHEDGDPVYGSACEDCYSDRVTCCDSCSTDVLVEWEGSSVRDALGVHSERHYTEDGDSVCEDCVYTCEDCGAWWSSSDSASQCCGGGGGTIHDYSYRPALTFWSGGDVLVRTSVPQRSTLYVGVEIEAESAADTADVFLADAGEEAGSEDFVYLKHDGSLGDGGVEVVTHPATPEAFLKRFPFAALEGWADRGARSYHRQACGMHIHVSRSAFTPSHLWRFVRFQMANVGHCIRLAQRESQQWAQWDGDGMDEIKKSLPSMVKGQKRNGHRYVAINFQNPNTVELRYFKGNLSPRIIRRQVLLVSAMYTYTKDLTLKDIQGGAFGWQRFAGWVSADPFHAPLAADL